MARFGLGNFGGIWAHVRGGDKRSWQPVESDALGGLCVTALPPAGNMVAAVTAEVVDDSAFQVLAAPSAGLRYYITNLLAQNADDTTPTWVFFEEDIADTEMWAIYGAVDGGGAAVNFNPPLVLPVDAALNMRCGTTGAAVRVAVTGYVGA